MKSIKALEKSLQLIRIEKKEEEKKFAELIKTTSIDERKQKGLAWYPILVEKEEIGLGEQWILEIKRTSNLNEKHQFRSGQSVELFCNAYEGKERLAVAGVVSWSKQNELTLVLNSNELPDWIGDGKLGIDLLYNEATFKEMEKAIEKMMAAKERERLGQLRETLLGNRTASFKRNHFEVQFPKLNKAQNKALALIEKAEDIAIVHGPPGTGKTTTLIKAIEQTLKKEKQVLVVAPSNTAVDLLVQKLIERKISVVRLGHPTRIDEDLITQTLDAQVATHRDYKQLKQLRKDAQKIKRQAWKFKRNFGHEERIERKALLKEARETLDYAKDLEKFIIRDVLNETQVVAATLVGSNTRVLRDKEFQTVFIDEAAQALEAATYIPILRAHRIVLAGDHFQLPPTVKSYEAQHKGMEISLFEKAIKGLDADVMLEIQYRMNEKIMQFSSQEFYQNKLAADKTVQHHSLDENGESIYSAAAVDFIDTAGCGFTEEQNMQTLSTANPEEAKLLLKYLNMIVEELAILDEEQLIQTSIGIISPYKEQVLLLRSLLFSYEYLAKYKNNISIHTVDGFQGQERDIIAISMVRSNDTGEIGFLGDIRRMNVAMTRAKKKLILMGDSATLANHKFYKRLLKYVDSIDAYKSAWELMY